MLRSIIELTLAINVLILSINYSKLSKQVRNLTNNVVYLSLKDLSREEKEHDERRTN